MSSTGFSIKDGVKLNGSIRIGKSTPIASSSSKYYPFKSTPVGMAAILSNASKITSKSPPPPPPIQHPLKEPLQTSSPQQTQVEIPKEIELKQLVSHLRTSHDYQEVLTENSMILENMSYVTSSRASSVTISSGTLVLFLLNTWAMDVSSKNDTVHDWMGVLNCLAIPVICMCIGYSMAQNNTQGNSYGTFASLCGCMSLSMFCILFLIFHKEQEEDYMVQHGVQLCGCILGSFYCTWRLSLKFVSTSSKSIEKARREWAVVGCLFLLQILFSLLAVFIQDPIIVLWVWAVVAWACCTLS